MKRTISHAAQTMFRWVLAISILAPCTSWAHDFCVTTSAEFATALGEASFDGVYAHEINVIHLVAGTYYTPAGGFHYATMDSPAVFISGGYNPDCSGVTAQAALTVLDGQNATPVLTILGANGWVVLGDLVLQNGSSASNGAGLSINNYEIQFYTLGPVYLSDLIIRNNQSSSGNGGLYVIGGGSQFLLADCLIEGNSSVAYSAGLISSSATTTLLYNNTITRNTVPGSQQTYPGGLTFGSQHTSQVSNNIFWGNTRADFILDANTELLSNDYGTIVGTPLTSSNNLSADPAFVDPDNGDFHLSSSSPLIAYSTLLEGTDLDGHPHPTSGKEDLGAYSTTVFIDGFDGN